MSQEEPVELPELEAAACTACGRREELRIGVCFECSMEGERRSAMRTTLEHLALAAQQFVAGKPRYARYEISWAWQRLSMNGDYAHGGYFDHEEHPWRDSEIRETNQDLAVVGVLALAAVVVGWRVLRRVWIRWTRAAADR